jgi:hypothetical protein
MGFYDYRCMATGVSLKGSDAALVLLDEVDGRHVPIALAITGCYNRLGAIDMINEDANTDLVLAWFLDRMKAGALVIDESELRGEGSESIDIEALLGLIERNVTMGEDTFVLDGRRLGYALIALPIWEAIVRTSSASEETSEQLFERLFGGRAIPAAIYKDNLGQVADGLRELAAVDDFLGGAGLPWRPPEDPEQHYTDDMREHLEGARQVWAHCPALLGGIDAYAQQVGDLLEDE